MSAAARASLLPVATVLLLASAPVALLAGRRSAKLAGTIAVCSMAGAGIVLALAAPSVYGGVVLVHQLGGWSPVHGGVLAITWAADPFGLTYALAVTFISAAIGLAGLDQLDGFAKGEAGQLWCLVLLLVAGLVGAGLTADLFNLFVWFELASVASYGITAFHLDRPSALEAAFKLAVLNTVAGFMVFVGIGLLYGRFGALNFGQLHTAIAHHRGGLGAAGLVASALLVAGFATKAGLIPLHGWLPDAHSAAPGPASALFSGVMVSMGVVSLARVALVVEPAGAGRIDPALTVMGAASALGGAALAFGQDDLKRLLAYDTIAQMGIVTTALGTGVAKGQAAVVWHLLDHGLFKALLFLVAGVIAHRLGTHDLSRMGGLARKAPGLTVLWIIGVAAIVGVPPLNGYASRVLLHGALTDRHEWATLAAVMGAEVLSFGALARATWMAFMSPERSSQAGWRRPGRPTTVAAGVLACGCLAFGVTPATWLRVFAAPAASVLSHPGRYAAAVTAGHGHAFSVAGAALPGTFVSTEVLLSTACTLVLGSLAAMWRMAHHDPLPLRALRALQTGSVNDYATYLTLGAVLLLAAIAR